MIVAPLLLALALFALLERLRREALRRYRALPGARSDGQTWAFVRGHWVPDADPEGVAATQLAAIPAIMPDSSAFPTNRLAVLRALSEGKVTVGEFSACGAPP